MIVGRSMIQKTKIIVKKSLMEVSWGEPWLENPARDPHEGEPLLEESSQRSPWTPVVETFCSGLEKSPFGAKSGFEIWTFKGFLYLDKKISPKKGLEVSAPKNVKWKKYISQSENANARPLEPLWGSK